jgi:DNA mismatch endonuclease, patch repair protein
MDIFSKSKRSEIMRKVKNKDTDIELIIRKELFRRGYRFRINSKLPGKPDVIFPRQKVAIFCDGDFWHGRNKKEIAFYKPFWNKKISHNISRDRAVNRILRKDGWTVIRLWKTEILKNSQISVDKIELILNQSKNKINTKGNARKNNFKDKKKVSRKDSSSI